MLDSYSVLEITHLFVKQTSYAFVALLLYVVDIILHPIVTLSYKRLRTYYISYSRLKTWDLLSTFWVLKQQGMLISICQRKYALDILTATGMLTCKTYVVPMDHTINFCRDTGIPLDNATSYIELISRLLNLTITRHDMTYAVNYLRQFLSSLIDDHLLTAHRVLRYIKSNLVRDLFYALKSELCLNAFTDTNWATYPDSSRLISGF